MDWQAIKHEYETTNATLRELADKFGCKPSTLRSHKSREKWQRNIATQHATKKQSVAKRPQSDATKIAVKKVEESELTDKQKIFALNYLKSHNATQSYIDAYHVDYNTANVEGPKSLVKPRIRKLLDELKKQQVQDLYLNANDIIMQYAKQAFADIGEYVHFGTIPIKDDDGNTRHMSFVRLKDDKDVDTSLINEVHIGKDGVVLKLYDKQKAMDKLMEYLPEPTNDDQAKDSFLEAIKLGIKQMQEKDD